MTITTLKLNKFKKTKGIEYAEDVISFDIETTSINQDGIKAGIPYAFILDINHEWYIGRTFDELVSILTEISKNNKLSEKRRAIIWVHNLAFEFQFIRKCFNWVNVLATNERKVIYAVCDLGFEFRCTYFLTNTSLANVAEIEKLSCKKLLGDLDYSLIRTPKTPLTETEIQYIVNDGEILQHLIDKKKKEEFWINYIPITKTAYVRRYVKSITNRSERYRKIIKASTLTTEEYSLCKKAFQGGFTHANRAYKGAMLYNVASFDLTSDYPYQMVSKEYPLGKGTIERYDNKKDYTKYACIYTVELRGIKSFEKGDNIISRWNCDRISGEILDNGRVYKADIIETTITDIDLDYVKRFYSIEEIEIKKVLYWEKHPLPKEIVNAVLGLYAKKTELKGVNERYDEYMLVKGNLNSCFGMCVTDIVRDEIIYTDDEWVEKPADVDKCVLEYNNKRGRFLFYPWGVWITANARATLFDAILELGDDYIYADTDSVKFMNFEKHKDFFKKKNEQTEKELFELSAKQKMQFDLFKPKDIKGEAHLIGSWDFEGIYDIFKTLGAKRYMTYKNACISMTVSGLNKNSVIPFLCLEHNVPFETIVNGQSKSFKVGLEASLKILDEFNDGLYIPKGHTGKAIHTYQDEPVDLAITDYLGQSERCISLSSVHLEESDYELIC